MIVLIVLGVLVGVTGVYALWRHQQRTGSWNPLTPAPASTDSAETGKSTAHSALDSALLGDTAAVQM